MNSGSRDHTGWRLNGEGEGIYAGFDDAIRLFDPSGAAVGGVVL